jgi:hypothetical protein
LPEVVVRKNSGEDLKQTIEAYLGERTVKLSKGTLARTEKITLTQSMSGGIIEGVGRDLSVIEGSGEISLFELDYSTADLESIVFRDLTVQGKSMTAGDHLITSKAGTSPNFHRSIWLEFERVHFKNINAAKYAFYGKNLEFFKASRCLIDYFATGARGFKVEADGYNIGHVWLENNCFAMGSTKDDIRAFEIANTVNGNQCKRIRLKNNHFYANGSTNIIGIYGRAYQEVVDINEQWEIAENSFEGIKKCIDIDGCLWDGNYEVLHHVHVHHNTFQDLNTTVEAGQQFLTFGQYVRRSHVHHNTFRGKTGSGAKGILDLNTNTSEDGNQVHDNTFYQITRANSIVPTISTKIRKNLLLSEAGNLRWVLGLIATPFYDTSPYGISAFLGTASAATSARVYEVRHHDIIINVSGGTVSDITLYDQEDNVIKAGLTSLAYQFIPCGHKIKITYTVAPTIIVQGL